MINKFAIKHAKGISHVVVEAAFPEIRSLGIVRALQKTGAEKPAHIQRGLLRFKCQSARA